MASTSKHAFTAGPCRASGSVRNVDGDQLWCGNVSPITALGGYRGHIASIQSAAHIGGISNDEAEANAVLIAGAFTVAHETGLTPRQLADAYAQLKKASKVICDVLTDARAERTELLATLREIETICTESAGDCRRRMGTRVGNTIAAARAAIAKTGGAA